MNTNPSRLTPALLVLGALWGIVGDLARSAPPYRVGDTVSDFTLYARRPWTNDTGRTFARGEPIQLRDFAGRVIFLEFFDAT